MKRNLFSRVFVFVFIASLALSACRQSARPGAGGNEQPSTEAPADTSTTGALSFHPGRNDYVITVDDTPREFIVHVPSGYDSSKPTPVVFMFHGTNQTGELMYEITSWPRKSDEVNAIVVFPTSWRYVLEPEKEEVAKWNETTLQFLAGPDAELKDDIKFTREVLGLMRLTFNVDEKRIFATGFSNGGSFVSTRLLFAMTDTFAAFSFCGSGARLAEPGFAENMPPKVSTSVYSIVGTEDEVLSAGQGLTLPFPFEAGAIMSHDMFGPMLVNTATYLNLDPTKYEVSHPQPEYTVFLFNQSLTGSDNEYIFQMVKDMIHVYPNGKYVPYRLDAVDVFWDFFMRHPMK